MSSWLFLLSGEVMEGLTSFEEVFEVVVKATQKFGKIGKVDKVNVIEEQFGVSRQIFWHCCQAEISGVREMMSEACHVKLGIWQGCGFRKVEENSAERREGLESKDTTKSNILQRFTF